MNNIKNIFFDLDHTIWDFEKNSSLTFKKILKDFKIDINLDEFLEIYVPINFKFNKQTAIIMGSEGKGISKSVLQLCDKTIRIPMKGKIKSLNVSVACGIILVEISKKS